MHLDATLQPLLKFVLIIKLFIAKCIVMRTSFVLGAIIMMIDKRLINTVADSKKMDWHHSVMELGSVNWRDY